MPDMFYYSTNGDRITLRPSVDTLVIAYRGDVPPKNLETLIRHDDQLARFIVGPELSRRRIVLYKRSAGTRTPLADFAARIVRSEQTAYVDVVYYLAGQPVVISDEFIAAFKLDTPEQAIVNLNSTNGVEVVERFDFAPNTYLLRVREPGIQGTLEVANRYYESGLVEYAEPNFIRTAELSAPFIPNDPLFPSQWHLPRIQAPDAWGITQGNHAVTIAIVDTGVDIDHEDFASAGKVVAGQDVQSGDNNPRPETGENHGTATAGLACADGNNHVGVTGVAPTCRLMALRLLGSAFSDDKVVRAFRFAADNGAAVISNSWNWDTRSGAVPLAGVIRTIIDHIATTGRGRRGCILVFSAGNFNTNTSSATTFEGITNDNRVVAVSAINDANVRSAYSNFGTQISVCAPSNDTAPGHLGIVTTDRMGNAGYGPGNYTTTFGGTSAACPEVAGLAALMVSINPDLTWQQVRYLLQATADKVDAVNTNAIGQYQANGHSQWYGFGRVNAFNAVKGARSSVPDGDFVHKIQITLRRTSGDRFVSTKVLHAIDARQRRLTTATNAYVRSGGDGFLHTKLGTEFCSLTAEVEVDE